MTQVKRPSVRERARAEMCEEIKAAARERLASEGANLSLRAVARDVGLVSSAVYRYFASRDQLLTALIIDAYDDLGAAVEQAESVVPRRELAGRWLAIGGAVRDWAIVNPHEYALLYGTPVPGYAAPEDTIGPASRPVLVLVDLLRDAIEREIVPANPGDRLPRSVRDDLEQVVAAPGFEGVSPAVLARGMSAWALLFGTLSFELFGRLTNAIFDYDAYFDHQLRVGARVIGI